MLIAHTAPYTLARTQLQYRPLRVSTFHNFVHFFFSHFIDHYFAALSYLLLALLTD